METLDRVLCSLALRVGNVSDLRPKNNSVLDEITQLRIIIDENCNYGATANIGRALEA